MSAVIEIVVPGRPQPGGSKTAMPVRRGKVYLHDSNGRPIVNTIDANDKKVRPWKKAIADVAQYTYHGPPLEGPLIFEMTFFVHRSKSHFGTGQNARLLKDSAPLFPMSKPDLTKLVRPVEDALTGILWVDDAQIVDQIPRKRFAEGYSHKDLISPNERVEIRVLPHKFATVGERVAGAQATLLDA